MEDNNKILTDQQEEELRAPIAEKIGAIQKQIDDLRKDGSLKIQTLSNRLAAVRSSRTLANDDRKKQIADLESQLAAAKEVEKNNSAKVNALIKEAEDYLKQNYESQYLSKVKASCDVANSQAEAKYNAKLAELKAEYEKTIAGITDQKELKDEKYVYKNKQFDAKLTYDNELQAIKDRRHEAFSYQYHLIDNLRMSKFTVGERFDQWRENYKYTFNRKQFFLKNGLYIVIVLIFIMLAIITPILKNTQLFTLTNILNILQQASPRMFLALGVAGLIVLTGTDLSVGRMVGMGMVTATIIMHNGVNTGAVFGHIFDFTSIVPAGRAWLALLVCVILTTIFATIAGFFFARFKMHPFISTMSNMLIIFGLVTYATKGVSFGAIDPSIPQMFIPKINGFPTIILWSLGAIFVIWFIWNKTTFGKNLFAVGGNPEAASVSGISVFKTILSAFMLAGVMYGIGAWLECMRMVGSGSAAYGQGWDMDAIAACVVGGVSATGGAGSVLGMVIGATLIGIINLGMSLISLDANYQRVVKGFVLLAAVVFDILSKKTER